MAQLLAPSWGGAWRLPESRNLWGVVPRGPRPGGPRGANTEERIGGKRSLEVCAKERGRRKGEGVGTTPQHPLFLPSRAHALPPPTAPGPGHLARQPEWAEQLCHSLSLPGWRGAKSWDPSQPPGGWGSLGRAREGFPPASDLPCLAHHLLNPVSPESQTAVTRTPPRPPVPSRTDAWSSAEVPFAPPGPGGVGQGTHGQPAVRAGAGQADGAASVAPRAVRADLPPARPPHPLPADPPPGLHPFTDTQ